MIAGKRVIAYVAREFSPYMKGAAVAAPTVADECVAAYVTRKCSANIEPAAAGITSKSVPADIACECTPNTEPAAAQAEGITDKYVAAYIARECTDNREPAEFVAAKGITTHIARKCVLNIKSTSAIIRKCVVQ